MKLREAVADPASKRRYTRWVFGRIADRYDRINVLLSFNRDQAWKRRMVEAAGVRPSEAALDLACGTGDIAFNVSRHGARVTGLDITPRMIELAQEKMTAAQMPRVAFVVGDMTSLPFPDRSFDLITTGYGIRNVPDLGRALEEMRRVLRPGGRMLSLDFNRPANALVRRLYLAYLTVVGSVLGWIAHGDPDTYRYIPETIRLHPGAAELVSMIEKAGFERVTYRPVFGGFMAMHMGQVEADGTGGADD